MTQQTTFLSKFGFHPVDHTTFLKLKKLKKFYWLAVYEYAHWRRWYNKQPSNRGVEPIRCPLWMFGKYGAMTWVQEPMTNLKDNGVLESFERARMPVQKPAEVKPILLTLEQIDNWLAQAETWWEEVKEQRKKK